MQVVPSVAVMLVDLSAAIIQVTVSVAIMQLEVFALIQVTVSAANVWVTIFIVIKQVEALLQIVQVVFSTVHYALDCFYCSYAGDCSCYGSVGDSFKEQFYIPFSN